MGMRVALSRVEGALSSVRQQRVRDAVDRMLAATPWYQCLASCDQQDIRAHLDFISLRAGQYLFRVGDRSPGWYGVVDGLVKWSSSGVNGKTLSLAGFGTGNWFGEATMVRGMRFEYDVIALRPSRLVLLPREVCERLWSGNIRFAQILMEHLAQRVAVLMASNSDNMLLDADTLVARALAAQLAAQSLSGGNLFLKLSQEEIASFCGVSRQRCNAAMTRLARAGVLETRYRGVTVLDYGALRRHAQIVS